ncbi:MAG: polysaccharide biosynthesis tyrosine autokinase [Candidatus Promineifilaceae bacterium]|nr:polysaccharide biosynthesis tyrosine autokinase [Candidatus Promineifilaceae bacterium]
MELRDYITPLRKWWWLIVAATVVAAGASLFAALQQPPVYQARTTLMIGRAIENPNPTGTEFWLTQQLAQTYAEIAQREPVQAGTKEALGLNWLPQYTVRAVPDTQLIEIAVTDSVPVRAQAVANEISRQLILQSPTSPEQDEQSRQMFISSQLDGLEAQITETEGEITQRQEELARATGARQIAEIQTEIAALQTKRDTLQANYAALLANTRRGAINSLNIIEPASVPSEPVGPDVTGTVLVAAAMGFLLAASAAYVLEYLDDTVSSAAEVERQTDLPTLAGIAQIDEEEVGAKLVTISKPRSPVSEAYRVLRTGVQLSSIDSPDQATLMVTSANPAEGKSLTIANLAVVCAQAGYRVVIVDADLRRPMQHKLFELTKNRGLTTFLLEIGLSSATEEVLAALQRAIQPTETDGLSVLTSGPNPPNPSELLGSAKMEMVLNTLGENYDFVLIDSPPVLAVTDAVVLSRRADAVLLVADAGATRKGPLKQAVDQLRAGNAHLAGVVLNRLTARSDGYYTYYYYRDSYYVNDHPDSGEDGSGTTERSSRIPWRRGQRDQKSGVQVGTD